MQSSKALVRRIVFGTFSALGLIAVGVFLWAAGLDRAGQWSSIVNTFVGAASFVLAYYIGMKTLRSTEGSRGGGPEYRVTMYNEKPEVLIPGVKDSRIAINIDKSTTGDK